jgi:hypothetical protein
VLVKVLKRIRSNRMDVHREKFILKNWFLSLEGMDRAGWQ